MKRSPNINEKIEKFILIFFYTLTVFLVFLIFRDFGIHIEEKFHRLNGLYWLNYISKVFNLENLNLITQFKVDEIFDYTLSSVKKYNKYGVIFDLPVALGEIVFKIKELKNIYAIKHFFSFIIFLFSSFFFFLILKKRFNNFFLSLIGTFIFLSTPRIFGDSFLYKDVLFLSFLNIALYFFLESLESINKKNIKNLIFFSFFTALSFNLRVFALVLPFVFFFVILIKSFFDKKIFHYLKFFLLYIIFIFLFIFVFSPYLWSDPFYNFTEIFYSLKKDLIGPEIKILFNSDFVYNRYVPETYLFTWIAITTPLPTLVFFLSGYVTYLMRFLKKFLNIKEVAYFNDLWRGKKEQKDFVIFVLLTLFILFFLVVNSPFYNGWRLVYFLNIFIIYFFIYQVNNLFIFLRNKRTRTIIHLILFFTTGYNLYSIIIFHPFQSLYFNELQTNEVHKKFEIDYHGLGGVKFFTYIDKIDNSKIIKIAVASHTPLQRSLEGLDEAKKAKFIVIGQEYEDADYIFKNNISEVNPNLNKKYNIPKKFVKINEYKINKVLVYEIFKKIK